MRKIVQLAPAGFGNLLSLCDDGTVWIITMPDKGYGEWTQFPAIPQEPKPDINNVVVDGTEWGIRTVPCENNVTLATEVAKAMKKENDSIPIDAAFFEALEKCCQK